VRFIDEPGVRRAFINTPGTHAVWLADDDGNDGWAASSSMAGVLPHRRTG